MTKPTLKLLEKNMQTHLSLQNINAAGGAADAAMKDNDNNDDAKQSIAAILEDILGKPQWKGKRASKLDLDDFLQLLSDFNQEGIHFC